MACHRCWEPPKPVVPEEAAGGGLVTLDAQCRLCTLSAAGPGAYRVSACWEAAGGAVGTCRPPLWSCCLQQRGWHLNCASSSPFPPPLIDVLCTRGQLTYFISKTCTVLLFHERTQYSPCGGTQHSLQL